MFFSTCVKQHILIATFTPSAYYNDFGCVPMDVFARYKCVFYCSHKLHAVVMYVVIIGTRLMHTSISTLFLFIGEHG